MQRTRGVAIGGVILSLALPLATARAQLSSGSCTVTPATLSGADACAKARDLFGFVTPQIGIAIAGGNPVPGEGGTQGGLGKIAISARVIGVDGQLPKNTVSVRATGAAIADDFGAQRVPIPVPTVDAAIGIMKGLPLGVTNAGGVDLLVGATYVPNVSQDAVSLAAPTSNIAVNYGARVGVLQESALVPGIAVSWMRRALPTMELGYRAGNDTLSVQDVRIASQSLRVTASKRLLLFGVAVGVGRDVIDGRAAMRAAINEVVAGTPQRAAVSLDGVRNQVTRNTAFVNASFSLLVARIVAEYGWSGAGALPQTVNRFGGRIPNDAARYASIGLTIRL